MSNHRSLSLTSDVAARLSASCSHGYQGRFHAQLLLSAVALIGVNLICANAAQAAGPAGSVLVQKPVDAGISPETDPLLSLVDEALAKNSQRFLYTGSNSPWEMAHGLVALRRDLMLRDRGQMVNAIDWLSNGGTYKGIPIFEKTPYGGGAHPYNGTMYDFEGHINQTLALLSMSNLPLTHTFTLADGTKLTMADMVRNSQMMVNREEETTWTLWFLTHYLDPEAEWTNKHGHQWSMASLVILQNRVNTTQAACGGTHNLFALAYARNAYYQKHGRLRGVWLEADQKIQEHLRIVRQLQNADGSFSAQFFKGKKHSLDPNERMKSTGHNLEWIMMALPQQRLGEEWVRSAVRSLAIDLINTAPYPIDFSPGSSHGGQIFHSIDALVLYRQRVSEASTFTAESPLASLKKIEESRKLAAARKSMPPAVKSTEAPKVVTPEPAVAATVPTAPVAPLAAPKPLTININGRPVRVAELPTGAVSDTPVALTPVPAPRNPALSTEPTPLQPIDNPAPLKSLQPMGDSPAPMPEPEISAPQPQVEQETTVPVPAPYTEPAGPSIDFVRPIPIEEKIEILPLTPSEKPIDVPMATDDTTVESQPAEGIEALQLPDPIVLDEPAKEPDMPMSAEERAEGEDATNAVVPAPESESAKPSPAPKEPAAEPTPMPKSDRPSPYVQAPKDVFVPLRRRFLPSRR